MIFIKHLILEFLVTSVAGVKINRPPNSQDDYNKEPYFIDINERTEKYTEIISEIDKKENDNILPVDIEKIVKNIAKVPATAQEVESISKFIKRTFIMYLKQ